MFDNNRQFNKKGRLYCNKSEKIM